MSFLQPTALLGLLAIATPVVIHLLMRPKPKRVSFPALRLVESTRRRNTRSVRLRHLRVLTLRATAIAAFVLLIARPIVPVGFVPGGAAWGLLAIFAGVTAAGFAVWRWLWVTTPRSPAETRARQAVWSTAATAAALLVPLVWVGGLWAASAGTLPVDIPVGGRDAPLAVVYVFDDSAGMRYVRRGASRLDAAKAAAAGHVAELPAGSRAAVTTASATELPVLFGDRSVVTARIDEVEPTGFAEPLDAAARRAVELLRSDAEAFESGRDPFARVVVVLTDLTRSSWSGGPVFRDSGGEADTLASVPVVLVDVGVSDPTNRAITAVSVSDATPVVGGRVTVEAEISLAAGDGEGAVVEFLSGGPDGEAVPRSRRRVTGTGGAVAFDLTTEQVGPLRGVIRLEGGDPLDADDARFLAVEVVEPRPVDLVVDEADDAFLVAEALAPAAAAGPKLYEIATVSSDRFGSSDGDAADDFWLINLENPSASVWREVQRRLEAGAEGVVVLGGAADPAAYATERAAAVLPVTPLVVLGFDPPARTEFGRTATEPFATLERWGATTELAGRDVRRHWRSEPAADAATWATFVSGETRSPAVVSRAVGAGRMWAVTTDLSGGRWNDWASAGWPYLALIDRLASAGPRSRGPGAMFVAGEAVVDASAGGGLLRTPALDQLEIPVEPADRGVLFGTLDEPGHYTAVPPDDAAESVFALNIADAESDLSRLDGAALDAILGADRYKVVTDLSELDRVVLDETAGVEPAGMLAGALLALLVAESWLANRFYGKETEEAGAAPSPAGEAA